ncbi:MAG: LptF/LptG family permease [Treponema sp.]|jgi:lipopolysaccharide export system permease protein|nr:LptF/LptG family permease [Treponema sp.]
MIRQLTLDRYLIKQFFPIFLAALSLFAMLVILIDLFLNLTRYLSNGASLLTVLKVSLFYIPKSISYALPVSLLFATAYTLGDLSTKNELTTILGSGIPFWRFTYSFILLGIVASFFAFFYEDQAVIPTLREKNRLSRELLRTTTDSISGIVIKAEEGRLIYSVDYYDIPNQTLFGVSIFEFDYNKHLLSIIHANSAEWIDDAWLFANPTFYTWDKGFLRPSNSFSTEKYREEPETFRRSSVSAADLSARDAALLIKDLRRAGLPTVSALVDYHHRFSFSAVPFVVIFLSLTVSGRFKKNILLLSLLASLGTAVVFFVIEMISMMSARVGLVPPFWGAWTPVFFCTIAGFFLLRTAKT